MLSIRMKFNFLDPVRCFDTNSKFNASNLLISYHWENCKIKEIGEYFEVYGILIFFYKWCWLRGVQY